MTVPSHILLHQLDTALCLVSPWTSISSQLHIKYLVTFRFPSWMKSPEGKVSGAVPSSTLSRHSGSGQCVLTG